MRRAVARGRIVPQSLSTDPRYGRLSLKAQVLYPLLWINADDQGRLSGDPDEIKYAACPSIKEVVAEEIPSLLEQIEKQGMIKVYTTSKTVAIQMLDWWEEQRLQWAWPSRYPPPEAWHDRLRYKPTPKEIVTQNWLPPSQLGSQPPNPPPDMLPSQLGSLTPSPPPSTLQSSPLTFPSENEKEEENKKGKGRGNIPGAPGSRSPASPTGLFTDEIMQRLVKLKGWQADEDDVLWLQGLRSEFPGFALAELKACIDYHSGRLPPKHKGVWKNRFRNWMIKKAEFERRAKTGEQQPRKGVRPKPPQERKRGPIPRIPGD